MEAIDVEFRESESEQLALEQLPPRVVAITGEINTYKEQAAMSIWEIGKRLSEAKDLLRHGQWLPWLTRFVDFSERQAQRDIKIFAAYSKSDTVSDLGLKKALILAALEPEEREELLPEAADMSAKELQAAVAAKQEAERRAAEAEAKQMDLLSQLQDLEARQEKTVSEAVDAYKQVIADTRKENDRLVGELQTQRDTAADLEAKLQAAKEAKKKADDKYKALKANPEIPEEALQAAASELVEAARKEEQAAAAKAAEALEKQVRLNTPVTDRQARYLADAARARAKELLGEDCVKVTRCVTKLAGTIKKAVLVRSGYASLREIPRCEYEVAMKQIESWNKPMAVYEIMEEARAILEGEKHGT